MQKTWLSLLPVLTVFILSFRTRKTLESLFIGSILGFILYAGPLGFFNAWLNAVYAVMATEDMAWLIMVCGLFGGFVSLLEKSGGVAGFSEIASGISKNRNASLLVTWILGIIIFIDDYLNALAIGATMRNVTDKFKIPREFLAYVINSTGATACVLIPFSTWSAFLISKIETAGVWGLGGFGIASYLKVAPFIFYAWIAILVVPLFSYKFIKTFGPIKLAEKRAELTGQVLPDSMLHLTEQACSSEDRITISNPKASNFFIPILFLGAISVYSGDMLLGVLLGILACIFLYIPQGLMTLNNFSEIIIDGFKDMVPIFGILIAAAILQQANDALGLSSLIIDNLEPILNPALLPVVSFVLIGLLCFGTGSFWGIAAIAFPIILPLAVAISANIYLVCGSIISGIALGSHACFFSDAATLTCASTQINTNDYARCVLPLITLPFLASVICYLFAGFFFSS